MRKFAVLLSVLVLVVSVASAQERDYYDNSFVRLNHVQGDVFVQRTEDLGQEAGVVNLVLVEGDKLGSRGGRAEVHFSGRNFLRMDNYTEVEFAGLPRSGYDQVRINLLEGEIFLRVHTLVMEKAFELHTPDASFYILDIGLYRWRVDKHGQTEVEVIEGEVEAAGEARSEVLRTGEQLRVSQGQIVFGPSRTYARYSSSFYEWNRGRDAYHNRSYANSYLPEELNEYEAELAHNGRWVYEQSYGNVWIPNVYHSTWRPYHNGRWMWYPVCGWTWISYDPWGWCVHHYGRWQWRFGMGWYWIPTSRWGPAWVSWYHGAHHYGWCPLSYHGYPGVIINNHYYGNSHHYYNSYPAHSRAMVMVHKNQLQDRNISRVALSSGQSRSLNKVSLSKSQPGIRPAASAVSRQKATARITPRDGIKSYSSQGRKASGRSSDTSARSKSSLSRAVSPSASQSRTNTYPSRNSVGSSSSRNSSRQATSSRIGREDTARSSSSISRYPSSRTSSRLNSSRSSPNNTVSRSSSRGAITRTPSRSTVSRTPSRSTASRTSSRNSDFRTSSRSTVSRTPSRSSSSRFSTRSSSRSSVQSRNSTSRYSSPNRSSSSRASTSRNRASSLSSRSSSRAASPSRSSASSRSSVSRSRSSSRSTVSRSSSSRSSASRNRSSSRVKKK